MNSAEKKDNPGLLKRTVGRDSFIFGMILGLIAPIGGVLIYKMTKLQVFTLKETIQYLIYQPGHNMLTVALSLSLLANAVLFTIYINARIDKTAKGIFAATCLYGLLILSIKTFL